MDVVRVCSCAGCTGSALIYEQDMPVYACKMPVYASFVFATVSMETQVDMFVKIFLFRD